MATNNPTVNDLPIILDRNSEDKPQNIPLLLPGGQQTTTGVVDTTQAVNGEDKKDILFVPTPIFMLFAEFLGYTSMLITMAEDWCDPQKKLPSKNMQRLLEREAKTIYDDMLEEFSEGEIHELYKSFYTCGLDELEQDLNEKNLEAEVKNFF